MIRVTSRSRVQMPSPDQVWSLTPGANHFESAMPDAVAVRLAKLQADGVVTVETLDGIGGVSPWHASPARITQ